MSGGVVLSDLHVFAQRSDQVRLERLIAALPRTFEFMVLNGDIFDFRWSVYASEGKTVKAGCNWLLTLLQNFPQTRIFYVMGNHDCSQLWAKALADLRHERFSWSATHCHIGTSLFIHGDLPLAGQNPYVRQLPEAYKRVSAFDAASRIYDFAVDARLTHMARLLFKPAQCVPKIHDLLVEHDQVLMDKVQDVYFGHTHVPFSCYPHKGIRYHNTGSGIRHMSTNMMQIEHAR